MKATTLKVLVISNGGLKGVRHNSIVKTQESGQTIRHTISGILSLKFFSFKSGGLKVEMDYDMGPGKRSW